VSRRLLFVFSIVGLCLSSVARAQFKTETPGGAQFGDASVQHWQVGVTIKAAGSPCKGVVASVPIPAEWPEQQVKVAKEDISPHVRSSEKTIEGVKQMVFTIANLPTGESAKALITYEVTRLAVLPPKDTAQFVIPESKDLDRFTRPWLGPSPMIDSQSARIVSAAKQLTAEKKTAWEKVETLYDYVRTKVRPDERGTTKGALVALQQEAGNHEDITGAFIALCRAINVPARTVWVHESCSAEFYLCDAEGAGRWFPCAVAGNRSFGGIADPRPILQKGDNFKHPDPKKSRQRVHYMPELLTGVGGAPEFKFVREPGGK
jgi:hypothetical protein